MARFLRAPIQSRKHEITWSNIGQDAATSTIRIVLLKGTEAGAITDATASEIKSGAKLNWIYFEFHFSAAQTGNVNVIHWNIAFEPVGTATQIANAYQQPQRRFIMKRGMEMLPTNVSTVFKRIFTVAIPKKFQRVGIDDEYTFNYQATSTQTINACGIAICRPLND